MMDAYIAWTLFTNLETFSTLIDFQKKCYGKYTPKYVFLLLVYMYKASHQFSVEPVILDAPIVS
jgi:hypothetical protein